MTIKDLVQEAITKNKEFERKAYYWFEIRKRGVDLKWLMANLEKALGKDYVRKAAKEEIERLEAEAKAQDTAVEVNLNETSTQTKEI